MAEQRTSGENKRGSGTADLPYDIVIDIFIRLKIKQLACCRCVCKLWRNIINGYYFSDLHHRISFAAAVESHLIISLKTEDNIKLHVINPQVSSSMFTLSQHPIAEFTNLRYYKYLGHGLFLVNQGLDDESSFLYNPINREKLVLPPSTINIAGAYSHVHGLVFNNFSNQYKLFHLAKVSATQVVTEIYTLGSNKWKPISAVPPCKICATGLFVAAYGDIHWLVRKHILISFEFAKEEFKITSLPGNVFSMFTLFNWRENLAILDITHPYKPLEMWVLRDYDKARSWEKLYTIRRCGGGCNRDLIGTWENHLLFDVHKYVACLDVEGFVENARELCCYNLDSRKKAITRNPDLSLSPYRRRDEKIEIYRVNLVSLARYAEMADESSRY